MNHSFDSEVRLFQKKGNNRQYDTHWNVENNIDSQKKLLLLIHWYFFLKDYEQHVLTSNPTVPEDTLGEERSRMTKDNNQSLDASPLPTPSKPFCSTPKVMEASPSPVKGLDMSSNLTFLPETPSRYLIFKLLYIQCDKTIYGISIPHFITLYFYSLSDTLTSRWMKKESPYLSTS